MDNAINERIRKSISQIEIEKIKIVLLDLAMRIDNIPFRETLPTLVIKKQDRINYILNGVCDYYETPPKVLLKRYMNPKYRNRKRILAKLLYDVADISFREVGEVMGTSLNNAQEQISIINEDLQENSYGNKELKKEYKELLSYLNL